MTEPSYLRDPVVIGENVAVRVTADAMRAVKKITGQTMSELLQGDDDADQMQTTAFLELWCRAGKLGHMPDAATLWEQAGAVQIDMTGPAASPADFAADPLDGGSSTTSPPSAGTGA